jgi:hypothetical protein
MSLSQLPHGRAGPIGAKTGAGGTTGGLFCMRVLAAGGPIFDDAYRRRCSSSTPVPLALRTVEPRYTKFMAWPDESWAPELLSEKSRHLRFHAMADSCEYQHIRLHPVARERRITRWTRPDKYRRRGIDAFPTPSCPERKPGRGSRHCVRRSIERCPGNAQDQIATVASGARH